MAENYSEIRQYIAKFMGFDKLFGPAYFILGIISIFVAIMKSSGHLSGIFFTGLISGCWFGLGIASITRHFFCKKINLLLNKCS